MAREPPQLRFLRRLVTTLTVTMIAGLVIIVGLFVIRFAPGAPDLALPDSLKLPEGQHAIAFTQAPKWFAVVTDQDEILIFDRAGGRLRQRIRIAP